MSRGPTGKSSIRSPAALQPPRGQGEETGDSEHGRAGGSSPSAYRGYCGRSRPDKRASPCGGRCEEWLAVLGGKEDRGEQVGKGVSHRRSPLRGWHHLNPTLRPHTAHAVGYSLSALRA